MDVRTFLTVEASLTHRLLREWHAISKPIYSKIEKAIEAEDWHKATQLVHGLDFTDMANANKGYIEGMLMSCAVYGAHMASKKGPSFNSKQHWDKHKGQFNNAVNMFMQTLEFRGSAQVQAQALQSIALAENAAKHKKLLSVQKVGEHSLYVCRPLLNALEFGSEIYEPIDTEKDKIEKGAPYGNMNWKGGLGHTHTNNEVRASVQKLTLQGIDISEGQMYGYKGVGLEEDTPISKAARSATVLLADTVDGLPKTVQKAIDEIHPTFALIDRNESNSNGAAWINDQTFTINLQHFADGLEGKPPMEQRVLDKIKNGDNFSLSQERWAGFKGDGMQERTLAATKDTIIHELGHLLTSEASILRAEQVTGHMLESEVAKTICPQANKNVREFLAESFLKFHRGDYVKGSFSSKPGLTKEWEAMVENMPVHKMKDPYGEVTSKVDDAEEATPGPAYRSKEWFNPPTEYEDKPDAKKADRFVQPLTSFSGDFGLAAEGGDALLGMASSLHSSRLSTWGFTAEAEARGIARYRLTAVLDNRTSPFCRDIADGREFEVEMARSKIVEALSADDPQDLREIQPWPEQGAEAIANYKEMDDAALEQLGFGIPPFHPWCRTMCTLLPGDGGEEISTGPTEVDNPVIPRGETSPEDMASAGQDMTEEELQQWNDQIDSDPKAALAAMMGVELKDVLSSNITVETDGTFGFSGEIEVGGAVVDVESAIDPVTGKIFLDRLDIPEGDVAAQAQYVSDLLGGMVDQGMSIASNAIVLDSGKAGYDYAKMGFTPQASEWQALRLQLTDDLETGALKPVFESLRDDEKSVVLGILKSEDELGAVALADLPMEYEGKPIGEILLEKAEGSFYLDLTNPELVDRAKQYL